jgi:hypothetical protein
MSTWSSNYEHIDYYKDDKFCDWYTFQIVGNRQKGHLQDLGTYDLRDCLVILEG